jgi:hypothetical protein
MSSSSRSVTSVSVSVSDPGDSDWLSVTESDPVASMKISRSSAVLSSMDGTITVSAYKNLSAFSPAAERHFAGLHR